MEDHLGQAKQVAYHERNTMADQLRLIRPKCKPLFHFARRLDVVGWLLERVT